MLDIEEKFKSGNYRNELLEAIQSELQHLKEILNSGLSPDEYSKYSSYAQALESSLLIINKSTVSDTSGIH